MGKLGQKAAFAEDAQRREQRAKKNKGANKKGKKKLTPTSRKGKNKFRY